MRRLRLNLPSSGLKINARQKQPHDLVLEPPFFFDRQGIIQREFCLYSN